MLGHSHPRMVFMVNEEYRNKYITLVIVGEMDLRHSVRRGNSQWCVDSVYVGGREVLNRVSKYSIR